MKSFLSCVLLCILITGCSEPNKALVIQTDFGLKDGAVNAMKGIAYGVEPGLTIYDLTHEIPSYNVWEAGYRLYQAATFWPQGTVFVSVVDPGVGTSRKSIVMKSRSGHFFVTPDNGTLTLVADALGIETVREIDETINRRPGSDSSYTFHGRDVYVYTAAKLAAGQMAFDQVGPLITQELVRLNYQKPVLIGRTIKGNIPVLDVQYGNVWTNINDTAFRKLNLQFGDTLNVNILQGDSLMFIGRIPYVRTFGDVDEKRTLAYFNSLMNFSLAINMGNFADSFNVGSGKDWSIEVSK